jgi:RecA-family ATPase
VLLLSAEDDAGDTIRPRLDAAGADCSRINILEAVWGADDEGKRIFSMGRDIQALEDAISKLTDCRLVIIDPISAYLDGTDSNKNSDVRGLLAPMAEFAAQNKIAVIAISHLNKNAAGSAMYRTTGSLAFTAAARAVYIVSKDKDNPERRLLMPVKNNIAKDNTGLAYSVGTSENGQPVIEWELQPVLITADEALTPADSSEDRTDTDWAVDFLQDLLSKGPVQASVVHRDARQASISKKSLRRAQEKLGIKPEKSGFAEGWVWTLPSNEDAQEGEGAHLETEGILGSPGHLGEASDGLDNF